jgi:hypothetical protein
MKDFWEIVSVILLSSVKFSIGGIPLALGLGFPFFKAVTTTAIGGIIGTIVFVYVSDFLIISWNKLRPKKKDEVIKKRFTWKNKIIISVKRRFGLLGISLLTPLLLSIPFGCFLAVRFFKNKERILVYMFASVLFWAVSLSSFKLLFPE